jgi:hypothetical protein
VDAEFVSEFYPLDEVVQISPADMIGPPSDEFADVRQSNLNGWHTCRLKAHGIGVFGAEWRTV